jgi:hypothetical protein
MMSGDQPGGPIGTATARLLDWLSTAGVQASVAPPDSGGRSSGAVRVWPLALLPEQAVRVTTGGGPLRLRVRHLLSTGAADPAGTGEPVDLLDRILLAATAEGPVHVPIEPVAADVWRAFGLAPRIGLYADVHSQVSRPAPRPPRVRAPIRLDGSALGRLHGRVVGPSGTPVPGIRVVAIDSGATAYTDNRGQFTFAALPAGRPARLLLSGKGFDLVAEVATPTTEPVVIHCDFEEV